MSDFLTGANLVWIVGIISSILAGLNALRKYRYEKKLEQFKEANGDLFKQQKDVVLAAIATLSVFKRDKRFEKHTINVLISRLYTELDYDITNAICNTLIQYSNREELITISSEILDINRNFFVQTYPIGQQIHDLESNWTKLRKISNQINTGGAGNVGTGITNTNAADNSGAGGGTQITTSTTPEQKDGDTSELEKSVSKELLEQYESKFREWTPKNKYELLWHKQVTADTYSRILRRAYHLNHYEPNSFTKLIRKLVRLFLRRKDVAIGNELDMIFYQNEFNYVYMADFRTSTCCIERSALGSAVIVDVRFNNISRISITEFNGTNFHSCDFRGGVIDTTKFDGCIFNKGNFQNIRLNLVSFKQSMLTDVTFTGSTEATHSQKPCEIRNVTFDLSVYKNCRFENYSIATSTFDNSELTDVVFENVDFTDVYFTRCDFKNVSFRKCRGLKPSNFFGTRFNDTRTHLPEDFDMNSVTTTQQSTAKDDILRSALMADVKDNMLRQLPN